MATARTATVMLTLVVLAVSGCGHWISPLFDTRDWGWWERKRIEREKRREECRCEGCIREQEKGK